MRLTASKGTSIMRSREFLSIGGSQSKVVPINALNKSIWDCITKKSLKKAKPLCTLVLLHKSWSGTFLKGSPAGHSNGSLN